MCGELPGVGLQDTVAVSGQNLWHGARGPGDIRIRGLFSQAHMSLVLWNTVGWTPLLFFDL
jgi:hypothetical protein